MKWNIQDRGSLNWRQRMNNCRKRPWKERLLCTVWQRWELSVRPKSFLPFLVTYNVNNKVFMRCFLLTQMRAVPSSNIGNSIPFKISASDAFPVQVVFVTRMAVAGIGRRKKRISLLRILFSVSHLACRYGEVQQGWLRTSQSQHVIRYVFTFESTYTRGKQRLALVYGR